MTRARITTHVRASLDENTAIYTIEFAHTITHCAATSQPGAPAAPTDQGREFSRGSVRTSACITRFVDPDGHVIDEPFMITVTCNE